MRPGSSAPFPENQAAMLGPPRQSRRCFLRQAAFTAVAALTAVGAKQNGAESDRRPVPAPAGKPDAGLEFIDQSFMADSSNG